MTTKADCAKKIAAYLASEISHEELLKWVDAALVKEDFPEKDGRTLLGVLSDLSAGRTSGYLSQIESYQAMLRELGFRMESQAWFTLVNSLPCADAGADGKLSSCSTPSIRCSMAPAGWWTRRMN
jgi:hypothetical protein